MRGQGTTRRGSVALVIALPLILAGCWWPGAGWSGYGPDGVSVDGWSEAPTWGAVPSGLEGEPFPPFPDDSPTAHYRSGTATVRLTGGTRATLTLDELLPGPHASEMLGTHAYWRNDGGWGLRFTLFRDAGPFGSSDFTSVAIDRIDTRHWMAEGACDVETTEASTARLTGTARCSGLRWIDMVAMQGTMLDPSGYYVEGEEPFDAEITFEATRDEP